jgi:hypothetical protein
VEGIRVDEGAVDVEENGLQRRELLQIPAARGFRGSDRVKRKQEGKKPRTTEDREKQRPCKETEADA